MIMEIEQLKHDFDAALKSIRAAVTLYGLEYVIQEIKDHVHATWDEGDILGFFAGLEASLDVDPEQTLEAQISQLEALISKRNLRKPS